MTSAALTAQDLLSLWERGERRQPVDCTALLLSAAMPQDSVEELLGKPVGCRDAALLDIREMLFGAHFSGVTTCPGCGEQIELSFDVADVRRPAGSAGTQSIRIGDENIEFRTPTTADLLSIAALHDVESAREALLRCCIAEPRRTLSPDAAALVIEEMARRDPQADVRLQVACPTCGNSWPEPFDIAAFLWIELATTARQLLSEVHLLASAYGWSEDEILRLSATRRAAYAEMIAGAISWRGSLRARSLRRLCGRACDRGSSRRRTTPRRSPRLSRSCGRARPRRVKS